MKKLVIPALITMLMIIPACGYKADLVLPDQTALEKSKSIESSAESSDESNEQRRTKNGTSRQ